jgi:predicted ATPase
MQLYAALGLSLMYTMAQARDVDPAWRTALALAEQCGNADYQLRAVWGLFAGAINSSNFAEALSLAQRFRALAQDANERLIGDRIIGVALHFIGDQAGAREHTERMIAHYVAPNHGSHMIRFQNDQLVAARRVLASVLWLQGYPEQAMRMIERSVADALAIDHAITLCNLLSQAACPIALLTGDLEATERYVDLLLDSSERCALEVWNAYGRGFRGTLLLRRGALNEGMSQLRSATADLRHANFTQYYAPFLGALAFGFGLTGEPAHGLAAIDEALSRTEMTSERYFVPELLRIKGTLVMKQGRPECARVAEELYRRALDLAGQQGALSWELRIAVSLASLLQHGRRQAEARELLAPVLGRFTEGLDTETPKIARQMLTSWGAA